jgi:hypothetical protein
MEPLIFKHLDRRAGGFKLVEESASLLDEEFRTCSTARRWRLDQLLECATAAGGTKRKGRRLATIVRRVVQELYGEMRDSWSRRLQEMAYLFHAGARQAKKTWRRGPL